MKECFQPKKFGQRAQEMIVQAEAICEEYAAQGFDLSVRQLYYQFVARNILKNTPQNYEALATVISEARIGGLIDWDHIKDRARVTHERSVHPSLKAYLQQLNEHFRLDKWKTQANYVEVMVEKQALEGVLLPICTKWEVPFTANKGYSSSSSMYERAKYIQSKRDVDGKTVHVLYLGDHDPSGVDMTRDVRDRLEMFSDGPVEVHRLALNIEQVMRLDLPENPAKVSDSRAKDYIERFGTSSWELDALDPKTLAGLVEHGIKSLLNLQAWRKQEEEQQKLQDELQTYIDELQA